MNTHTVLEGQSLFDIALQTYGHVEGIHWLLEDNPGISLTHRLKVGQVLVLRSEVINRPQRDYLAHFGPLQTIDEQDRPVGINYWYLEEYRIP